MNTYFDKMNIQRLHFAVIGRTDDVFCDQALNLRNLDFVLHEHLKHLKYNIVAFYDPNKQIYFLDQMSHNLATGKSIVPKTTERLIKIGPLSKSVINEPQQDEDENKKMSFNLGPMNSDIALGHIDKLMTNQRNKTAIIVRDTIHFMNHFASVNTRQGEISISKKLDAIVGGWKEGRGKENIIIWCFRNCDIYDPDLLDRLKQNDMWMNFFSPMLNAKPQDRKGTVINVATPSSGEIRNLINYHRIKKGMEVDFSALDDACELLEKKARGQMLKNDRPERKLGLEEVGVILEEIKEIGGISLENIQNQCGKIDKRSAIERLNEMSGLENFKSFVENLRKEAERIKAKRKKGIEYHDRILIREADEAKDRINLHVSIVGNPGTGKTTVAKLLGEIYRELGLLQIGSVTKVTRSDLVAEYTGQTGPKTRRAIEESMGGVLFIDEAYDLYHDDRDSFGKEASAALLEMMSDRMGEFAVIIAGYPKEIEHLIRSNPGFDRRFATQIVIEDYSPKVLAEIFINAIAKTDLCLSDSFNKRLEEFFERYHKGTPSDKWGNAGTVLNLVETMRRNCQDSGEATINENHLPQELKQYMNERKSSQDLPKTVAINELRLPIVKLVKPDAEIDVKKMEQAVLFITTKQIGGGISYGTGFLISPQGHVLTCNHVIDGATEIEVRVRTRKDGDKHYKCKVMNTFKDIDVALLKIDGQDLPYLSLEMDSLYEYKKGSLVCLSGYPFGTRTAFDCTYTEGKISSTRWDKEVECINIDISGKCGNSGGPVVDKKTGKVVGVFVGSIIEGDRLIEEMNYMRPISYFQSRFIR
ncbi:MAG: trypsin-like peptidase domain-containing protein [Firmicutes bacterium]|nr:trypsin-like peptidase domain-containing protein [Bacillota bacterium]